MLIENYKYVFENKGKIIGISWWKLGIRKIYYRIKRYK